MVAAIARSGAAAECDASAAPAMATLGLSKVFILDKYFTELQKFWETEKKLQGERPRPARAAPRPARCDHCYSLSRVPLLKAPAFGLCGLCVRRCSYVYARLEHGESSRIQKVPLTL